MATPVFKPLQSVLYNTNNEATLNSNQDILTSLKLVAVIRWSPLYYNWREPQLFQNDHVVMGGANWRSCKKKLFGLCSLLLHGSKLLVVMF